MRNLFTPVRPRALTLLLASVLAASAAVAGEAPVAKQHKIVIDRACEGADCPAERHVVKVFVDENGEAHQVEGGDLDWVGGAGHQMFIHEAGRGGFLGVMLTELTPELRRHFGAPETAGVMVSKVVEEGAARLAGVEVGDIITAIDGEAVASAGELAARVRQRAAGDTVTLEAWRDGRSETLSATLGKREAMAGGMPHFSFDCKGDCKTLALAHPDCGGADPCQVEVRCQDGGACDCTVNGESADCESLPGVHPDR